MKKLSKELQKRISEGDHGALTEGIEELIDMYNNKPWTEGYEACKDDVCIHSSRLLAHLHKSYKDRRGLTDEEAAKVIEEYFENALKA